MLKVSSSFIKEVFFKGDLRDNICWKKLYHEYVLHDIDIPPTEAMLKGLYFETKCIGAGAHGQAVYHLPRKAVSEAQKRRAKVLNQEVLGEKKIDHIRIDMQVERFKEEVGKYFINIIQGVNTQVTIRKWWDKEREIMLVGTMDIFPTTMTLEDGETILCGIDLKLTQDINSTFGEYCWGAMQYMDVTQLLMYHYLARDIDEDLNEDFIKQIGYGMFKKIQKYQDIIRQFYLVFGYKVPVEELEYQVKPPIEVEWDKMRELELKETIRKFVNEYAEAEDAGFPATEGDQCIKCPLRPTCKKTLITKI